MLTKTSADTGDAVPATDGKIGAIDDLPIDDDEFFVSEAGSIATQYDISVFKAREIMGHCGSDANCIKLLAEKAHEQYPVA